MIAGFSEALQKGWLAICATDTKVTAHVKADGVRYDRIPTEYLRQASETSTCLLCDLMPAVQQCYCLYCNRKQLATGTNSLHLPGAQHSGSLRRR